jgi:hypothetical protein
MWTEAVDDFDGWGLTNRRVSPAAGGAAAINEITVGESAVG